MLILHSLSTIVTSWTGSFGSRLWATCSRTWLDNEVCTSICNSIADWACHQKRRHEDIKKDTGNSFFFFFFSFFESFCLVAEKVLRKLGKKCISEFRLKFKLVQ